MRTTSSLMNGALIGFGVGFIAASLALRQLIIGYIPETVSTWQFNGVAVVGGVGLVVGIGFEVYERIKARREEPLDDEEEDGED